MTTTEPTPEAVEELARVLGEKLKAAKGKKAHLITGGGWFNLSAEELARAVLAAGYVHGVPWDIAQDLTAENERLRAQVAERRGPYIEVDFDCVCGAPLTSMVTVLGGACGDGRAWPTVMGSPVKHRCPPVPESGS